jgi:hypothetical protein
MFSIRHFAFLLALATASSLAVPAQSSSSQAPEQQPQAAANPTTSVQARIRARRAQRRANAIRETYLQRYEFYTGTGYMRFVPGPDRQRATMYAWNVGLTRYYNERLGVTVDGRGNYGTAYVGQNPSGHTRPAISFYTAQAGPTYRFYVQPRFALSGRVMAGYAGGNFTSDTNGFGVNMGFKDQQLLYHNGSSYAANASVSAELNISPSLALRLAPEYNFNGFDSRNQYSRGFTGSIVYRFGKQ